MDLGGAMARKEYTISPLTIAVRSNPHDVRLSTRYHCPQ